MGFRKTPLLVCAISIVGLIAACFAMSERLETSLSSTSNYWKWHPYFFWFYLVFGFIAICFPIEKIFVVANVDVPWPKRIRVFRLAPFVILLVSVIGAQVILILNP